MKKLILILLAVSIGYISYQFFLPTNKVKMKHAPEMYFKSKKVQKFCYALIKNDFKTTDKLLKNGLDINTVGTKVKNKRKNEYAPTPLVWLFLGNKDTPEKLKAFKYLLDNGADPMVVFDKYNATMLFEAAGYQYPDYLRLILSSKQIKKNDLNIDLNTGTMNTPLLHAMATNRFENFKLLLDAGADMNWIEERTGRTTLHYCATDGDWKYAYELLKRGADYTVKKKGETEIHIVKAIADPRYWPSVATSYHGVDYRQKCVEFLREKGLEIHPWMPEGEKYVTENGEDVLYVQENGQWVKYKESEMYKKKK